ncbi:MAG TPA: PhnD/SsuA/transferrin family substrate-binding protein [Candidatus Eisenbergiella merdipullorum]|uniref:PhnD/SsuA/transferrin family substrate-binding protein n=1 Tax=Candidatus Eisenbergiella merdipullorum TaxID=2838553 RepID=A0A9D2I475_9FIRM|nr:PhnD/SsuA/transferrin family substrate-binding protein [Candidatus Eisenbergiella merdipullorum]
MKKALSLIAALALSVSMLAGCAGGGSAETAAETTVTESVASESTAVSSASAEETAAEETASAEETATETASTETAQTETAVPSGEETAVNVMALKGPTAMGMVELMNSAESGPVNGNSYTFTIAASADEVTPKLVQGDADIAAVPANLASVLYNNTEGQVQVLAINTLGVLYIVENGDTIHSVSDLAGKTIYASGKGSTPEYALNYILSGNGLDPETDVTIEWKSEHSECVAALASDEDGIAMLPQPFVTTAQAQNENLRIALDLTEEWDALQADSETPSALLTGVVVVRTAFAEEHPDAVNAFLDSYKESVDYVNANVADAAALIEKYDIVTAAVAQKAIPYCNIVFIEGSEMQEKLSGYLNVLYEQNPASVGGALPADDFYYIR